MENKDTTMLLEEIAKLSKQVADVESKLNKKEVKDLSREELSDLEHLKIFCQMLRGAHETFLMGKIKDKDGK